MIGLHKASCSTRKHDEDESFLPNDPPDSLNSPLSPLITFARSSRQLMSQNRVKQSETESYVCFPFSHSTFLPSDILMTIY